ncbi:glycosyltransferase family 20-domain-containing protein [Pyronema domesticum]|nr:glycosyltransferase family 20-domain-containing protein [Pyronema domesticum]
MSLPSALKQLSNVFSGSPLSQSASASEVALPDPADAPTGVQLSGNIISATFLTPYTIGYRRQAGATDNKHVTWELTPRRGSSALYDTLKHLALKENKWSHTIIGWTGEISEVDQDSKYNPTQHLQNSRLAQTGNPPPAQVAIAGKPTPPSALSARSKSYITPPPVPIVGDGDDRMTMKGDYSRVRTEEEQNPCVSQEERDELQKTLGVKCKDVGWDKIRAVWLGDERDGRICLTNMDRWMAYAEKVLWPTFHYIIPQTFPIAEGATLREKDWWKDYNKFNNAYADEIMKTYTPGDIIWIHDYHLLMLPEILRKRLGRDVHIGLFVHAPWPSSEIFRIISHRKQILTGMLAANMIAFQSETYKEHFISCCKRILGFGESLDKDGKITGVETYGSHCAVHALPIGIDYQKVRTAVTNPDVQDNMDKIQKGYGDRKIIVGRDRLDSVRGVLQKLRAFERFLENHPEWIDKVVLIQITSPSSLIESQAIELKVSELVSKINGRFGSLHYTPVQHYPQYLQPQEYFALLRVASLGLITSVRDGMNTASLEYIICQAETHGPVILSEFTGTAESLHDAIIVNPTNTAQVAFEINRCLTMSLADKKSHHKKLYDYVTTNTSQAWNTKFLRCLFDELERNASHPITPVLDFQKFLDAYKARKQRIFMFDYDGTLAPIVQDPEMAIPADRVVRTLKRLAQEPGNSVWIISGRDQKFLSTWLGHIDELGLSAEHGCFLRRPGATEWENLAEMMDMSWQKVAEAVFQKYTEKTAGSFIEKKNIAVTWHYRRAELGLGRHMAALCHKEMVEALAPWPVEVMEGKANLEVRPQALNKGEIVKSLVRDMKESFVFCAGDDRTDEDMFRVLNQLEDEEVLKGDVFAVTVGPSSKITEAKWHLLEPSDVVDAAGICAGVVDIADLAARGNEEKR